MSSRAQGANGINSADNVAGSIGRIGLADVGQGLWVTEDRQGLLEFGQVLGAEDDGDGPAVARDGDAVVFALYSRDHIAEMVADIAKWLNGHGHNCGAQCPNVQARGAEVWMVMSERSCANPDGAYRSSAGMRCPRARAVNGDTPSKCTDQPRVRSHTGHAALSGSGGRKHQIWQRTGWETSHSSRPAPNG
jgi:hypothetical protein